MKLEMQEGEYGFAFELTVYNADASVHVFDGTETVQAYVVAEGGTSTAIGSSTIHDASGGVIYVTVQAADVATLVQGEYALRVKVTGASSVLIPEPEVLSVGPGVS